MNEDYERMSHAVDKLEEMTARAEKCRNACAVELAEIKAALKAARDAVEHANAYQRDAEAALAAVRDVAFGTDYDTLKLQRIYDLLRASEEK